MKRHERWAFLGILVLSAAVYYFYVRHLALDPLSHTDAKTYFLNAQAFDRTGELREYWAPELRAWRPHGYAIVLGVLFKVFGPHVIVGLLWNAICFNATLALLTTTAYRLGGVVAAAGTALLYGTHLPFYYYGAVLLPEATYFFGIALSVYLFQRALSVDGRRFSPGFLATAGFTLGLFACVKTNLFHLPLLGIALLAVLSLVRKLLRWNHSGNDWVMLGVFLMGFICGVTPYLIRNSIVLGAADRIVSYSGYNLYLGNVSLKYGDARDVAGEAYYSDIGALQKEFHTKFSNELAEDQAFQAAARQIIVSRPKLFLEKFVRTVTGIPSASNSAYGINHMPDHWNVRLYHLIWMLSMVGAVAMALTDRYHRFLFLLTALLGNLTAIIGLAFQMNRFMEPLVLLLLIPAGIGAAFIFEKGLSLFKGLKNLRPSFSNGSARP